MVVPSSLAQAWPPRSSERLPVTALINPFNRVHHRLVPGLEVTGVVDSDGRLLFEHQAVRTACGHVGAKGWFASPEAWLQWFAQSPGAETACERCYPPGSAGAENMAALLAPMVPSERGVVWRAEDEVSEFSRIRITSDRPLSDESARRLFGCIGYAFKAHFRGEPVGWPAREATNRWTAFYDITKSRSDDWLGHFAAAMADARVFAVEGSPVRKRDGSRLVEGVGPIVLRFEFD